MDVMPAVFSSKPKKPGREVEKYFKDNQLSKKEKEQIKEDLIEEGKEFIKNQFTDF